MHIVSAVDMLLLALRSINAAFVVAVQQPPPDETCATNSKCITNALCWLTGLLCHAVF